MLLSIFKSSCLLDELARRIEILSKLCIPTICCLASYHVFYFLLLAGKKRTTCPARDLSWPAPQGTSRGPLPRACPVPRSTPPPASTAPSSRAAVKRRAVSVAAKPALVVLAPAPTVPRPCRARGRRPGRRVAAGGLGACKEEVRGSM